ncbi:hypothetical protein [Saccharopolyspora taberi]|uniref:Uncharacterized protein n=1 Tax=Saccharopolyspora taberi TaxID=60895 RepID=A0ABN3VCI3_9PSEU
MTVHTTYGTAAHNAGALARLIAGRLGVVFAEHDSYYRGAYLRAETSSGVIEIQPNAIPGDDGEDDLYEARYPEIPTLLLVAAEQPGTAVHAALESVGDLRKLAEEPVPGDR